MMTVSQISRFNSACCIFMTGVQDMYNIHGDKVDTSNVFAVYMAMLTGNL